MKNYSIIVRKYGLFIILSFYLILILNYFNFVPFFDGGTYFSDVISSVTSKFNLMNFVSWGHPSIFYFLYIGLFQYIDPGNTYLLHLSNTILGLLAIYAFFKILLFIFPDKKLKTETYIITAIFAFQPVFTASTLNLNLDFGLACFFIIFLYLLFYQKNPLLLILFSLAMIFTKEPGIVLYFLTLIFYIIFFITRNHFNLDNKFSQIIKKSYFLIPFVVFVSYLLYKRNHLHQTVVWGGEGELIRAFKGLFTFDLFDKNFLSYLAGIFILNFNWLMSYFIACFGVFKFFLIIINSNFIDKNLKQIKINYQAVASLFGIFLSLVYIYTRYKTFLNVRYFLPIYSLLIIIFYYTTICLIPSIMVRKGILIVTLILIFMSNFKTLDPASKLIFGTFKFGKHDMLYMTSISGELPAYGRDQIVYNLEYTNIHYLLNLFFQDKKPNNKTTFFKYQWTDWGNVYSPLTKNYKRTFKDREIIYPNYLNYHINLHQDEILNLQNKPKTAYYIDLPIFKDSQKDLLDFLKYLKENNVYYLIEEIKPYEFNGHEISVYKLKLSET